MTDAAARFEDTDLTARERKETTYRYERWRATATGVLEAAGMTFLLLIAVRHFEAGPLAKALIGSGASLGLLLGPWLVSRVQGLQWPAAFAASRVSLVGATLFLLIALFPIEPVYVIGSALALGCASIVVPLMTQVYQENYPERERGRLFSRTVVIRIATVAVFSFLAGHFLSGNMARFRWLLFLFAGAFVLAGFCQSRCPSRPLTKAGGTHPFRSLRFVRDDRLFRVTLIAWMLMGFGNLMTVPLRVEYLANPTYGWEWKGAPLTAGMIALLTGVLPNTARLMLNPFWGWAFDRMNFFVLRITLNLGFMLGILAFFTSGTFTGLVAGAFIYGTAHAGGDVAWSLWVTKFAPPERVADYMSVHTFFTGVRGAIAPLVAFQLVGILHITLLGWISGGLIVTATALLVPQIPHGRRSRPTSALTEEVMD